MQADSAGAMDISSLVDICFLLLIYFIVTSVIQPAERDLPFGVPTQQGDDPVAVFDPYLITIDEAGAIASGQGFERIPLDADPSVRELPLLVSNIKLYMAGAEAADEDCVVVIDADGQATSQRVIDVLNALAGLDIDKVTFRDSVDE